MSSHQDPSVEKLTPAETKVPLKRAPTLYAIVFFKLIKGVLFLILGTVLYFQADRDLPQEYADLLKKGERDKFGVVPNKPETSFLVELIRPVNGKVEMPRGKEPLPEPQIKTIVEWIRQGATDDTPDSAKILNIDEDHPPTYQALPVVTR